MKKIISLILAACLLLSFATVVYANDISEENSKPQEMKESINLLKDEIKANQVIISGLRETLKGDIAALKAEIKKLKEDKEDLLSEKITNAIETIKDCRRNYIGNHKGKIKKELRPNLKLAKKSLDFSKIEVVFQNMIDEQEIRIADLRKAIAAIELVIDEFTETV